MAIIPYKCFFCDQDMGIFKSTFIFNEKTGELFT